MEKSGRRNLKDVSKDKKPREIRLTFKQSKREQQLRRWLLKRASPSAFLKDLAFKEMDAELSHQSPAAPGFPQTGILAQMDEIDYD